MKKYLVNFATPNFYEAQKRLNKASINFGIIPLPFTMDMIKNTSFYNKNKDLLNKPKGAGYWAWKPYIILEAMRKIKDGDVLFYCDSGINLVRNPSELIHLCKKNDGILIFANGSYNKNYVKRDCFILMGCDKEKYWNAHQVFGGFQAYIKNERSKKIVKEWLKYVQIPSIVDDSYNKCGKPNFPGFIQHSWDQSVLANIVVKRKIKLHRRVDTTDEFNPEFPNDKYPVYLMVDRKQKRSLYQKIVLNLKMILPLEARQTFKMWVNNNKILHNFYYGK